MRFLSLLLVWLTLLVSTARAQAPVAAEGTVVRVEIEGTRRIEEATVLAAIGLRRGQTLTTEKVRRDLKAVYATGFFDDVRIESIPEGDGVALVFHVVEKPAVRAVALDGNKKINEDDIMEVIDIGAFAVLNDADVKANVERIRDLYVEKGFFLAEIDPVVTPVADDQVDLTFHIVEGRKVQVSSIDFTGNLGVTDAQIRKYMQTKVGGPLSFITSKGAFRREVLEQDQHTIRYVFLEEGYVEVNVDPPKVYLSPDKRFIFISFHIEEDIKYDIGTVEVVGDFIDAEGLTQEAAQQVAAGRPVPSVQDEQWRKATGRAPLIVAFEGHAPAVTPGDVFKYTTLQSVVSSLTTFYGDQGYAFANVTPYPRTDPENAVVDITFHVEAGEKYRIGRINITGNDPTFDKVVRREILLNEGDIYRGSLVQASRARLDRLGYFEDITFATPKGDGKNVLDVNMSVTEQPTGSFSFGAGYSNLEKLVLTGSISKNNFMGLGYTLTAAINWSRLRRQWNVSLFDPYFLDSRWTLEVNGYAIQREYQLDEFQRGGSVSIGRYLDRRDDIRMTLDYTFEHVGLTSLTPSQRLMLGGELYRNGITSSLGVGLTIDKRNNRIKPWKGVYASIAAELAGGFRINDQKVLSLLGGDFNFWSLRFNFRFYQPLIKQTDWLVFRWNTTVAHIGSTDGRVIPYIHRFRAGGINSVRGYDWFSLGPSIRAATSDDPVRADDEIVVGGSQSWINNFELESPIVRAAGVAIVVFFDAGNAFGDPWGEGTIDPRELRFAYGAGVRWQSPIGPLRFEYGIPINPKEGEKKSVFDFSIGGFF